jgi:hypothetical protein
MPDLLGRERLERLDGRIEKLLNQLLEHEDVLDQRVVEDWVTTVRRLALRLSTRPPRELPPEAVERIRLLVLESIAEHDAHPDWPPLDVVNDIVIRIERIRHVVRDTLDADVGVDENDAQRLVERLREWLPTLPQRELGRLVGKSTKQIQRWSREGGDAPPRLQLVARLVALLHRSWTAQGVVGWFDRPRRELDGKPPIDVLDDGQYEEALLEIARKGRAQYGS